MRGKLDTAASWSEPPGYDTAACLTQAALDDAAKGGRKAEAATWRHRMHRYLHALFRLDPAIAEDFHHYQARQAAPPALIMMMHLTLFRRRHPVQVHGSLWGHGATLSLSTPRLQIDSGDPWPKQGVAVLSGVLQTRARCVIPPKAALSTPAGGAIRGIRPGTSAAVPGRQPELPAGAGAAGGPGPRPRPRTGAPSITTIGKLTGGWDSLGEG